MRLSARCQPLCCSGTPPARCIQRRSMHWTNSLTDSTSYHLSVRERYTQYTVQPDHVNEASRTVLSVQSVCSVRQKVHLRSLAALSCRGWSTEAKRLQRAATCTAYPSLDPSIYSDRARAIYCPSLGCAGIFPCCYIPSIGPLCNPAAKDLAFPLPAEIKNVAIPLVSRASRCTATAHNRRSCTRHRSLLSSLILDRCRATRAPRRHKRMVICIPRTGSTHLPGRRCYSTETCPPQCTQFCFHLLTHCGHGAEASAHCRALSANPWVDAFSLRRYAIR